MRAAERGGALTRLARRLIAWLLPADDRFLLDELDDLYRERVAARGRRSAGRWYARQAVGFALRLGGSRLRDEVRAMASGLDIRHALRSVVRRPAWSLGVIATLAFGVGGVASVYAVANWVLLRPVPGVTSGDEVAIVRLGSREAPAHVSWPVSNPDYEVLRASLPSVHDLAAASPVDVHLTDATGVARRVAAEIVTPNYFAVLGVRLAAGRAPGADAALDEVVVTHRLAVDVAGSAAAAPGREVRVNGRTVRIAGVAPAGFRGPELPGRSELWLPLAALRYVDRSARSDVATRGGEGVWSRMYGRLVEGATAAQVELAANAVMERIRASGRANTFTALHYHMDVWEGLGPDPSVRASVRATLALLGAASAFLLLLAVANVANLTAVEATSRHGANAIRFALGARTRTLAAQWCVEATLLGTASAVGALGIATLLNAVFRRMRLDDFGAPLDGLRTDGRVLLFTLGAGLLASLLAGLPMALAAGRAGGLALLGRALPGARRGHGVRSGLVIVQVALSVVLVAGAGLLGRTVANLRAVDLGLALDDVLAFSIDPALDGRPDAGSARLVAALERRLEARPGVAAAGFISPAPLSGNWLTLGVYPEGGTWEEDRLIAAQYHATPGFLRLLGADIALRAGEVVVTRGLAARAFATVDPAQAVGRVLLSPYDQPALRIAHVIDDVHLDGRPGDPPPTVLMGFAEDALRWGEVTGWVRASQSPAVALAAVRDEVSAQASDLPVFGVSTAREAVDRLSAERVVLARVASLLGVLGLVLAAVGLYGVLGRAVAERVRELGVRIALGASRGRLLRDVALQGVRLGALGCLFGVPAAFAASRVLRARLFGVDAFDPATHVGALIVVLLFVVLASLGPALRATRVSPLSVMRHE